MHLTLAPHPHIWFFSFHECEHQWSYVVHMWNEVSLFCWPSRMHWLFQHSFSYMILILSGLIVCDICLVSRPSSTQLVSPSFWCVLSLRGREIIGVILHLEDTRSYLTDGGDVFWWDGKCGDYYTVLYVDLPIIIKTIIFVIPICDYKHGKNLSYLLGGWLLVISIKATCLRNIMYFFVPCSHLGVSGEFDLCNWCL